MSPSPRVPLAVLVVTGLVAWAGVPAAAAADDGLDAPADPDQPAPQPPPTQAPPQSPPSSGGAAAAAAGTGIPFLDNLLKKLPQGEVPAEEQSFPVLKEGDPRPVIGFRFDHSDFLNAYFKDETLRTYLRLRVGEPLSAEQLEADRKTIWEQYRLRGFLHPRVRAGVEQTDRGDLVVFSISAGPRSRLACVEISGNLGVEDDALTQGFFHRPYSLLSGLNVLSMLSPDRGGVYHAGYLEQDRKALVKNYEDHGYFDPRIKGSRAHVVSGRDRLRLRFEANQAEEELCLVFDVEDGPLFRVGVVLLSGDLPGSVGRAMAALGVAPGQPAAMKTVDAGVERLLDLWRDQGYQNARAHLDRRINLHKHLVDLSIRVDKGRPTRVGAIRIIREGPATIGPNTAERVIRRDLAVATGRVLTRKALRLSEQRLMYTGFFQKAALRSVPTDDPEVVDVEVVLVEQQNFYFSLAPSWIPGEGLVGFGFIGSRNLIGQGWRVNAAGVASRRRLTVGGDFEDPRVLNSRVSLAVNAHRNRYVYPEFSQVRLGGGVTMGYPMIEYSMLTLGYMLELVDIEPGGRMEGYIGTARLPNHKRRGAVTLNAVYDRRDNVLLPTRGFLVALGMEHGGPLWLGELQFLTINANVRGYLPLPFGFVLKGNLTGALVTNPIGGVVPVSERFYMGGPIQDVRGYGYQTITPEVTLGDPYDPAGPRKAFRLGGVSKFLSNVELESPALPFTSMFPVKVFCFVDAGNTWSEAERPFFFPGVFFPRRDDTVLPLGLFYSVGVGGMLATTLFPLRVEVALPLTRRPQDEFVTPFLSAGSSF